MRKWAAVVLLVGLGALPAQAGGYNLNFNFGGAIPMAPEEISDNLEASYAFAGSISGPISGVLRWRGEVGYGRMKYSELVEIPEPVTLDETFAVTCFGGGIEVAAFNGNTIRPYGYFTVGLFNSELSATLVPPSGLPGATVSESETDFGLSFGGGINMLAGEKWGVGFDVRGNAVFLGGDADTFWYMTPSAQAFFRF